MDMFDIDMEFLRLIDGIRRSVTDMEDGSADAVIASIEAAGGTIDGRAGALLQLLARCWVEAPDESSTPPSRLWTATANVLDRIEQSCVSEDAITADQLIERAASALLEATDREADEWQMLTVDLVKSEALPHQHDASPDLEPPDLDELASVFLLTSPHDRDELTSAIAHLESLVNHEWLPKQYRPHLDDAAEGLAYAVSGKRKTKKKTEAAEVSLGQIGTVINELMIIVEGAHSARPLLGESQDGVEDEAKPEGEDTASSRPQPVSVLAMELAAGTIEFDDEAPDDADLERAMEVELKAEEDPEGGTPDSQEGTSPSGPQSFNLVDNTDTELLEDFITEGFDHLDQAEEALLLLENKPKDVEAINVVFRAFHTIKGVAGFLELDPISTLAHHAETLLSSVREGSLDFSSAVADITLKCSDTLRALLTAIRSATQGKTSTVVIPDGFSDLVSALADPEALAKLAKGISVEFKTPALVSDDADGTGTTGSGQSEGSVRVKTQRLDRLLDLVGELVVAHAMVAEDQAILTDHQSPLAHKVARSEKILRELQDMTTSMRMVPMKPAFHKLSRLVRDVSRKAGKPVRLITEGEETELDRSMVNIITDPLVHMMRNAIDHGLETPEERVAAGKPAEGVVTLKAEQSGGSVVIEISDDGRGLDREKIVKKAIEKGIIDSDRGMSDADIFDLIFAPGFSTADQVTDISGRGVGMDVVKRSVESLRGRVDIRSTKGEGSVFSIRLPLTLAITDGMLIRVGRERYIIPTIKIHMTIRPEEHQISTIGGGEMVMVHDELLPLIRLHEVYDVPDAETVVANGILVIVGEGARRSAALVDEILGQQQFVVKALQGLVANVPGVAGGTIMSDGSVGLILDPEEIITIWRGGSTLSNRGAA